MAASPRSTVSGGGAVIDSFVLIAIGLFYCAYRLGVTRGAATEVARCVDEQPSSPATGSSPCASERRSVSAWAFDYGRMTLESAVAPAEREQTLYTLAQLIEPLIGHVRLCDVDDDLERGVSRVLAAQLPGPRALDATRTWTDFIHWARGEAALERFTSRPPF